MNYVVSESIPVELWDSYVSTHPDSSFFHLSGWESVFQQAFNHRTHYIGVYSNQELRGVLPLVHVKSILFGNYLSSLPFCSNCGVLASDNEAYKVLIKYATQLCQQNKVDYLELRNQGKVEENWPTKDLYVGFKKEIFDDEDKNFNSIPRKQRAVIRKAIGDQLISKEEDSVDPFYFAYSTSVRNLGTPVFSKKYFKILQDVFSEDCKILSIYKDEQILSSVMSFYFKDEVLPYYGGGISMARNFRANDFMYWELMRRSASQGIGVFDFGRSKVDSGSYRFKKHWGFVPEPLYYQYKLFNGSKLPNLSPTNPKYKLLINLWGRMPLALANSLGPFISRYLG